MQKSQIVDADFEVVDGPYRVGDEHRERKGWFLTDKVDKNGDPLWYKPPGPISRFIRVAGAVVWIGAIVLGILITILTGGI